MFIRHYYYYVAVKDHRESHLSFILAVVVNTKWYKCPSDHKNLLSATVNAITYKNLVYNLLSPVTPEYFFLIKINTKWKSAPNTMFIVYSENPAGEKCNSRQQSSVFLVVNFHRVLYVHDDDVWLKHDYVKMIVCL